MNENLCVLALCNYVMLCCVFCSEERVLLQKLLFLHVYCSRLWVRLGEVIIASDDICCHLPQRTFESSASEEHSRLTDSTVSANDYSAIDCSVCLGNGASGVTVSEDGEESVTDSDGIGCPSLSGGDGPLLQFNIPSAVLQSLTCFVAAT